MTRPSAFSLRGRLLVVLLSVVALVWSVLAVTSYFDARHEINEVLDAHLTQSAALLMAQTEHEALMADRDGLQRRQAAHADEHDESHEREHDEHKVTLIAPVHRYERGVAFQIWEEGNVLRLRSAGAPPTRLSGAEQGFNDVLLDNARWRVFSQRDASRRFLVQVGERAQFREDVARSIARNLLYPMWIALPILGLLVWFGVGRGLAPLRSVNRQIARRAPDYLEAVDGSRAPGEVRPLVDTLNRLLDRVRTALENERRFTADAAHELRTPLAALKTQAQVALAAPNGNERAHALQQVLVGCNRASRLVDQMLTLARLDPHTEPPSFVAVDLRAVAVQVVGELTPGALVKGVELGLAAGHWVEIRGDSTMIAVMLRNLIDNAVRYTPRGGTVEVALSRDAEAVLLTVTDNGPGIAAAERERVGERFYRVLGSAESGSGLGLSIVRRVCELHGAHMRLEAPKQSAGLSVIIRFAHTK